ncbi:MAG: hypothetical protein K2N56_10275 [Oscillospiraceae bacterium]|nr:hypothetical protein [Oscillospiraceae bacterium]
MTRRKVFSVIAVVLSLITLSAAASWCSASSEVILALSDLDEPNYISESDFSFSMMISVFSYIWGFVHFGANFATVIVLSLGAWAIFGFNSVKNYSDIADDEIKFSMRFFRISFAGTLAAAMIIMTIRSVDLRNGVPYLALLYCWENPFFMWLFYIRRFKKR